jgi:stearoyl-CoA desaturase (Delta-9 desaturase)
LPDDARRRKNDLDEEVIRQDGCCGQIFFKKRLDRFGILMECLDEMNVLNVFKNTQEWGRSVWQWFDADHSRLTWDEVRTQPDRPDLVRCLPFVFLHLGCLAVIWVGWSPVAVAVAILLYLVRMFAITAFYHRYFSHRTFKTGRLRQFLFAVLGASAAQRGPLWWAYHHRNHHRHSDDEEDVHSPWQWGFWWAHIGWITSRRNFPTDYRQVKDFARFPELRFLNRFDLLVPLLLMVGLFATGTVLGRTFPALETSGGQMLVWGFFISTTFLFHATASINSLAHLIGRRRFATPDQSRNSFLLSLITLGEGWHNNHHRYMTATRQGFYWWEIDITFYGLKVMSWLRLVHDLRPVPIAAYADQPVPTRPENALQE